MWAEATGAWPSDLTKLNKYQQAAFHKVYSDRVINQVVSEMNQSPYELKAGSFINEDQEIRTAQKELSRLQGKNQDVLEIKKN